RRRDPGPRTTSVDRLYRLGHHGRGQPARGPSDERRVRGPSGAPEGVPRMAGPARAFVPKGRVPLGAPRREHGGRCTIEACGRRRVGRRETPPPRPFVPGRGRGTGDATALKYAVLRVRSAPAHGVDERAAFHRRT